MSGQKFTYHNTPTDPLKLLFIAFIATLVGMAGTFTIPPLDRDESRFIQATTQMLETGDFIKIKFQEQERNKKPAGIYWLQAASVTALSSVEARQVWAYRIPSLLAAVIAATLLYWVGCRLFNEETAFLATLIFIATPSFAGEATIAKTDAALVATVMAAQAALAIHFLRYIKGQMRADWLVPIIFWGALGVGLLIKGPITPMISILTLAALFFFTLLTEHKTIGLDFFLKLRPVTGALILALLVGPWLAAIHFATEGRFLAEAVGKDMAGKITTGQERHGGPFGYHMIASIAMFWPGIIFLPAALVQAFQRLSHPGVIFCLAWIIPSWLVFEIASTKLPHYVLPLYPALALLCAHLVVTTSRIKLTGLFYKISRWFGMILYVVGLMIIAALFILAPHEFATAGLQLPYFAMTALFISLGGFVLYFYFTNRGRKALLTSALTGILLSWILFEAFLPQMDRLNVSVKIAEALEAADLHPLHDHKPDVAMLGYYEPSIVFLLGTNTHLDLVDEAAQWARTPGHVIIVEDRQRAAFDALTQDINFDQISVISGANYSNGDDVRLSILQAK
ncbi:MAG: ArnT family glycosyltransferase [bacterium]